MSEIKNKSKEELLIEIQKLRSKLAEAEETLRAIRSGKVDALVVSGSQGEQVFTLKSAEQPYRVLIEEMNEGAVMLAPDDTVLYCNYGFARMLKTSLEKIIGTGIEHFVSSTDHTEFEKILRKGRAGSSKGEIIFIAEDGAPVPTHLSINSLQMDGISTAYLIVMDLTERKQAEKQIHEQATLLDKAHDAINVRNLEHRIIYWNKGAQRIYGWTTEEAIGKNADELLYKEESSGLIEAKKRVIKEEGWDGELHQITKYGTEIIVESRWTLVHDNEGKPKSILIINTDITDKKKLESQLLRAQRMESIGTLAGGIAHDLNNVLTPIMLSLQMLKIKFKDEQSQKLIEILENNSQRGANLIKQVLSFVRGVEGERNPLQIRHIVSEIDKVAKETFPRSIEVQTNIPKDLFVISGDATQLHQLLMNLCVNARDAMPDGGLLNISVENVFIDENYARMSTEAKVGSYIAITVSDTGTGIPPQILDRIFEPFFTTKEHGKGTGLGLSTALAIVKGHGGFINVYSEVRKGTRFKVYLPAIETVETQKIQKQRYEPPAGLGELVLVVDDETHILEITRATLETSGYKVLTASDGAEAVAIYVQNREKIKVVIMDIMMPVMDGPASIRMLRKINPQVKIIAVSGLATNGKLSKATYENIQAFLIKPFTAERLLKTIYDVLSVKSP